MVTVTLSTPDAITIESRPALTFIARSIVWLLGGTELGEAILSSKLPADLRWNGHHARLELALPQGVLPRWLSHAGPAVFRVTQDSRGLWITFDALATAVAVVMGIVSLLCGWRG